MPASIRRWESALVDRVAAGDESALATIFDQYGALVYGIAGRMLGPVEAVEVTQDVFDAVWDHPEQFSDDQRPLRTILAALARRRVRDVLRVSRVTPHAAMSGHTDWSDVPPVVTPNVDESASALFTAARVRGAFEQLPEHEREAVELAYDDALTFREVAVRIGTSESVATTRVRSGLERLDRQLRDRGPVGLT